jgi:hypothetical protein
MPGFLASLVRDALGTIRSAFSSEEFALLHRMVLRHTMVGHARLAGLHRAVTRAIADHVPGDVVECGAARGGSAALMALTLERHGDARSVWVLDTFEGLPPPTQADPGIAKFFTGRCRGDLAQVRALFEKLGVAARCKIVQGLFQDTLPGCGIGPICVLHLDGDWYESVKVCLDLLYDRVSPGGTIQIDDYGHWSGARRALDEFLTRRGIDPRLRVLDYTGLQFTKA